MKHPSPDALLFRNDSPPNSPRGAAVTARKVAYSMGGRLVEEPDFRRAVLRAAAAHPQVRAARLARRDRLVLHVVDARRDVDAVARDVLTRARREYERSRTPRRAWWWPFPARAGQ